MKLNYKRCVRAGTPQQNSPESAILKLLYSLITATDGVGRWNPGTLCEIGHWKFPARGRLPLRHERVIFTREWTRVYCVHWSRNRFTMRLLRLLIAEDDRCFYRDLFINLCMQAKYYNLSLIYRSLIPEINCIPGFLHEIIGFGSQVRNRTPNQIPSWLDSPRPNHIWRVLPCTAVYFGTSATLFS